MFRLFLVVCVLFLYATIGQLTILIAYICGLFDKKKEKIIYLFVVRLVFKMILVCSGVSLDMYGKEYLEKINSSKSPVMIVANHRSFFDVIILLYIIKLNYSVVVKKEFEKIPIFSFWIRKIDGLFIDRENAREGMSVLLKVIDNVKNGMSVIIFPEGTRNRNKDCTSLLPFKEGSFIIAKKTQIPIYTITMLNTDEVFERQLPLIRKTKVKIKINEPFNYDYDNNKTNEIAYSKIKESLDFLKNTNV